MGNQCVKLTMKIDGVNKNAGHEGPAFVIGKTRTI